MGKIRDELIFKKLNRLMNGPLATRRTQGAHKLKRRYHNKYNYQQASWNKNQGITRDDYQLFKALNLEALADRNRTARYIEFDSMDFVPELHSALDIYADEITTCSELTPLLHIETKNESIKQILEELFYDVLNLESNLFGWVRNMVKYGDYFMYLDLDDTYGVVGTAPLPLREIRRFEGLDPLNPNYVKFSWDSTKREFESTQIAHFRIYSDEKYAPYGVSVLEGGRRIFRQLTLMEDAMMAYRVVRSAERRVFYLDVGGIPHESIEPYVEQVRSSIRRNQIVDEDTGQVTLRYNAMSIEDDYVVPVHGRDSATRIETLPGGQFTGDIEDVQYLRDKLFSAIKIPQEYLTAGREAVDQGTLSQKDIRFARTVQRLQRYVIETLQRIAYTHLYLLKYQGNDLVDFKLRLNNPSRIAELQELEHWKTKLDVAVGAGLDASSMFSRRYIFEKILGISPEEFDRNNKELDTDKRMQAKHGALEQGADASGGGAGGALDDMGFGEEGVEGEGEVPTETDDDSMLITSPGRREANQAEEYLRGQAERRRGIHTTSGAKGKKYKSVSSDKRDLGANTRHNKSLYGDQYIGRSDRSKKIKESEDKADKE